MSYSTYFAETIDEALSPKRFPDGVEKQAPRAGIARFPRSDTTTPFFATAHPVTL